MRAPACAIVALIGLAAHPASAQTDRAAAPFWKAVQATCNPVDSVSGLYDCQGEEAALATFGG